MFSTPGIYTTRGIKIIMLLLTENNVESWANETADYCHNTTCQDI